MVGVDVDPQVQRVSHDEQPIAAKRCVPSAFETRPVAQQERLLIWFCCTEQITPR